jgi:glycosyltransferase 2 family protein
VKRLLKPLNLVWIVLALAAILAIRVLPWKEIFQALRSLTLVEMLVLLAINGFILLLFSTRWWLILRAYGYTIPYIRLSGYRIAGFAISYFTPGTQFGGEPLQVYLVQSRHAVPDGVSLAAVTLDKLLELITNFSFLIIGFMITLRSGLIPRLSSQTALAWAGILPVLLAIYFAALTVGRFPLTRLVNRLPLTTWRHRTLHNIPPLIASTERQISALFRHKPLLILVTISLSALVWGLMVFEYWLMAGFLGARLSLLQSLAGFTATRVAFLTPLPGGIGVLEASQVMVFTAFGFSAALGISLTLLMRARDLLVGLFGLWIGGLVGVRSSAKSLMQPAQFQEDLQGGLIEPVTVQVTDQSFQ